MNHLTYIGSYKLEVELGAGGQAIVYKAAHSVLKREVALKVLHAHLSNDADFVQKFAQEGQTLAQLEHPNIVTVYDAGRDAQTGLYYIAMELLSGRSVDELLAKQGRLPVEQAVSIAQQVAAALAYAHARRLIHRDIKPSNMFVQTNGTVKVLDFGIATLIAAGQKAKTRIGTVEYMAFEQFQGGSDERSDLYSLGASLYHMLTGTLPPPLATQPPLPPRQLNTAVSPALEQFVYRALQLSADARPQTAIAFRQEMQNAVIGQAPQVVGGITCHDCGQLNRAGAKFCNNCRAALTVPLIRRLREVNILAASEFRPEYEWSPNCAWLAYTQGDLALYLTPSSSLKKGGSHTRKKLDDTLVGHSALSWSPTGARVAFLKGGIVRIADAIGTNVNTVAKLPLHGNFVRLRWNGPTEKELILKWINHFFTLGTDVKAVQNVDFNQIQNAPKLYSPQGDFWVQGSSVSNLTIGHTPTQVMHEIKTPQHWVTGRSTHGEIGEFVWSANGNYVIARYLNFDSTFPAGTLGNAAIVINRHSLTVSKIDVHYMSNVVWSPVREEFAIDTWPTIAVVAADGSRVDKFQLSAPAALPSVHGWSRDGNHILIEAGNRIYTMNRHTQSLQELGDGFDPKWSPDGKYIAFLRSTSHGNFELWVMEVS